MLARIENEIFSSRGDSLIFFFSLSLFWKLESIFFKFLPELFEFRIVSIGKSSRWDENKERFIDSFSGCLGVLYLYC